MATPSPAFTFALSFPPASTIGGLFEEVSGIDAHADIEHRLPGATNHPNLVLKRGTITQASTLADWVAESVSGSLGQPLRTMSLDVRLLGPDGQPLALWTFSNAWPVKWEVADLDAAGSPIVVETLEIAYADVAKA